VTRCGDPPASIALRGLLRVVGSIAILTLTGVGVGAGTAGCGHEERRSLRQPVTLLGIDGATWRVIDPMLARGALPNLGRLVAEGVRAPLRSESPLASPPIWTTIATGVSRERHGIPGFHTGGHFISSRDRKVPALWTLAHAQGLRSATIGWWATFPAEPVAGVIVSERALKTREADLEELFFDALPAPEASRLTHPPDALQQLSAAFAKHPTTPEAMPGAERVIRDMAIEDTASVETLLALRREHGPFDLELLLLRGVDPVSHFHWGRHEAATKGEDDPVEAHYSLVDALLGRLIADAPDRTFLLISDHGFEAGEQEFRGNLLSGTHVSESALHGIFVASGGVVQRGIALDELTIYDVLPLVQYLLGAPIAADLDGQLRLEIVEDAFAAAHPPEQVARYTVPATTLPPPKPGEETSPFDAKLGDELRALGYIE
jgi:predicted AlkP superfamily phosphohydrolase/phosphomutase